MNKNDLINDVIVALQPELEREQLDRVKITMLVKFEGYELQEIQTLPSVVEHDNNFILKRFMIDALAKGTKPSSIETYMNMIKPFFESTGLNYRNVKSQDITDYLARKQFTKNKKGEYPSQNYISVISRAFFVFFQWAYRRHHIPVDIMLDVDRIKQKQKKKDKMTDEEVERGRKVCKDIREEALYELLLCTGMRVGEVAATKIEDIDMMKRTIHINGYKSDSSNRDGILSIKARNAIREYIGSRTSGPLFIGVRKSNTQKGLSAAALEKIAKEIGERAGVHCKTNVHCYRKTFACELYKRTKDIKLVSIMLGHADTAVTEKYYLIDDMEEVKYQMLRAA